MMKVYICPECGWIRVVSRRKNVECHKCGYGDMRMTNLSLGKFSDMTEEERSDYAEGWQYIHRCKGS